MKEYHFDRGREIDLSQLRAKRIPHEIYSKAHQGMVIACQDIILEHNGGALLIVRKKLPFRGILWPLGGRMKRGMPEEESLRRIVKEESGLDIENIRELDNARLTSDQDPFGHGKGTDTKTTMYFARGRGELKLDENHEKPTIVKPEDYTPEFRAGLHPYVRNFMDRVIPLIKP